MRHTLTVDIENLQADPNRYVTVTFPTRTKIVSATFTVNSEAYGSAEDDRSWTLYALASHPYDNEGYASEWIWPIFFEGTKPVVQRENNLYFRSDRHETGVTRQPHGTPHVFREAHHGVMAPGDYLVMWIGADDGNFDAITWEETRGTITLEYEESPLGTTYENRDWASPF